MSHPARITSSLSVEYLWGQLVPDFAALVRSLCVALEAWPQGVAKPVLFPDPGDVKLDAPLGLQYKVRHFCLHALRCPSKCPMHERAAPLSHLLDDRAQQTPNVLSQTSLCSTCTCAGRCTTSRGAARARRMPCVAHTWRQCHRRQPATCSAGRWRRRSATVTRKHQRVHACARRVLAGATVHAEAG